MCINAVFSLKQIRCSLAHISISHVFYWCSIIHFRFTAGLGRNTLKIIHSAVACLCVNHEAPTTIQCMKIETGQNAYWNFLIRIHGSNACIACVHLHVSHWLIITKWNEKSLAIQLIHTFDFSLNSNHLSPIMDKIHDSIGVSCMQHSKVYRVYVFIRNKINL